ncbi:MAG: hypothetical protein AAFO07_26540, partial [Bacteroidota bacterium]
LVNNLCLPNGYYFNNGKKYQGQEIKTVYNYMTNENWQIKLYSGRIEQVNNDIAYDIGTYQSTGKGQYVLIWKKTDDGWKILLDFNF